MKAVNSNVNIVYFIGIAGIGMSALARYFNQRGADVYGYDRDRSSLARELEDEGISIHYQEDIQQIPIETDMVVYTPAIPDTSLELTYARTLDIPVLKRSEVLGYVSRESQCIAVAGTHGKTTTSAFVTHVLQSCGTDCTAFLGGIVSNFGGNFVSGSSDWVVIEADEFDRSFLQLTPSIAIITTMDPDHLDIYGSFEAMCAAYRAFIQRIRQRGVLIIHEALKEWVYNDRQLLSHLTDHGIQVYTYGGEKSNEFCLTKYVPTDDFKASVTYQFNERSVSTILQLPGMHNAMNALAAVAVNETVSCQTGFECGSDALVSFKGIKRRFELLYRDENIVVIDDYAHHPNEVKAAIEGVRMQFNDRHVTGVFQPHLYSRTMDFYQEFAESLSDLDTCILVEIYPAREQPIDGVTSELIFDAVTAEEKHLTTKKKLIDLLRQEQIDVLLLMGAGDLDRMSKEIIDEIRNKTP